MSRAPRPVGAARRPRSHSPARAPRPVGVAVLTASDTRRAGEDTSGALIERLLVKAGHRVVVRAWVKDRAGGIRRAARAALARPDVDVLLVTGGTGIAPRDVTPEALAPLAGKALPGFGELFRVLSVRQVGPAAWLSRAGAFVARDRLVVYLPGSRAAVELALKELLIPELNHAVRLLGRFHPTEE